MYAQPKYDSVDALRKAVTESGSHFFDRETLKHFDSQIGETLYGGRFFVTGEADDYDDERRYTVRGAVRRKPGDVTIVTVGKYRGYATKEDAEIAAKQAASLWERGGLTYDETKGEWIDKYRAV